MKLTTFQSSEPVLSPENRSVENQKIIDIQIIGGAQYFKRSPAADCGLISLTLSTIPIAHEIVSLAQSAAPINPALLPNCAWTTSTWSESTRKTRARIERRIGSRINSPAAATPPPLHA